MVKKPNLHFSDFVEFAELVTGMVNRQKIALTNKVSRKTVSVKFKSFFDHPLSASDVWKIDPPTIAKHHQPWIYGVDGKWLKRQGVILIHRDITNQENLFWSFHKSESYSALSEDLTQLSILIANSSGNYPIGVVSDWKMAIVTAVASQFGPIPHQRCLSHVIRSAKHLLPAKSPIKATIELRQIALGLTSIKDQQQKQAWELKIKQWEQKYGSLLKERTIGSIKIKRSWWYTHGNLRRGFRLLTHDQESLFVYLNSPLIPKSNNSLEGVNSQLDQKLGDHRGMKIVQQISFAFWHLTIGNSRNNLPKLKKLWDYWKTAYNK